MTRKESKQAGTLGAFNTSNIDYDRRNFHRHHVIPKEIVSRRAFFPLFLSMQCLGFDPHNFATNGILLPCTTEAAITHHLPLHRGPHRHYNELVAERIGMLMRTHFPNPLGPVHRYDALAALYLLQRGLKRGLSRQPAFIRLNRRDPLSRNVDFRELDKEVEMLWGVTGEGL